MRKSPLEIKNGEKVCGGDVNINIIMILKYFKFCYHNFKIIIEIYYCIIRN